MKRHLIEYLFPRSVRAHLVILVLIAIIPALGIILYSGFEHRRDAARDAETNVTAVLNSLAAEHERIVESTRQLLVTLSKLREVRSLDLPACNSLLAELLSQNPVYTNLLIADPRGIVVASGLPSAFHSVKHRKYFQDTITTKAFSVGEYSIGALTGKPNIHFAFPITDKDNRLKGIVVAAVNAARYGDMFLRAKLPQNSVLSLTDHKGIRLFRYPDPDTHIGQPDHNDRMVKMTTGPEEGIFTRIKDGEKRLLAYKRFRLTKSAAPYLFMSVGISEKKALARVRTLLLTNLSLLGIAFFIAVTSALIIGRAAITGRFERLVQASRKLGMGDLKARTGLPHGKDELGYLAKSFDEMADELERKEYGRRQAEEALTAQFQFLQKLIDAIPNAVFHKDTNGLYQGCNKAFLEYTGFPRASIVGKSVFEVHSPEIANTYHKMDTELFAHPGIQSYETIVRDRSGRTRDIILSKATYDGTDGVVAGLIGVMVDITDRTQAEKRLSQERHNFSSLCESAPFGMNMTDRSGSITYINPKFREMFGYDLAEIPDGRTWFRMAFPDPDYRYAAITAWLDDSRQSRAAGATTRIFAVICKDGTEKIVSFTAVPLRGGGYIVSSEDITARTRSEEVLKESEETLRALVNATRETLLLIDTDGTVLVANEVVAQRLGTDLMELVGSCIYDHFPPDVAETRKEYYGRVALTGQSLRFTDVMREKLFDQYIYPVFNTKGIVSRIAIFAHDITERARAEEEKAHLESQLRQSQKMEAIGTLAGGIAHDFNNILTAIIGYGSLLQMNMEASDPRRIYADHILASSQKAAALTQSLLAFGRKQVIELKPRKVSEVIGEAEELLKRLLTEDIEFRVIRRDEEMVIKADVTQISQVLMNLVTNARDAMPRGGKLTLETKAATLGSEFIQAHGFGEAGGLCPRLRHRYGYRHGPEDPGEDLRALLHHQGGGKGNRARPLHRLRHREAAQRVYQCHERGGKGNHLHDLPPYHKDPGKGDIRGKQRGEGGRRDDPCGRGQ